MSPDISAILPQRTPGELNLVRRNPIDCETLQTARTILDDIESRGNTAVRDYAVQFGDCDESSPITLGRDELAKATQKVPARQINLLRRVADRIRRFAQAQLESIHSLEINIDGGRAGHRLIPVKSAGCYAPGGRFPLPSSVLMTAMTARVAEVSDVWVASPRPSPITLAAAHVADASGVLAIGGIQAVGAFAFGYDCIPHCDVIVGPGNRWVSAAKQLVAGRVRIDMVAGPSEIVVVADQSANTEYIALDLLAQAEHDPDALPILITTSPTLADAVRTRIHDLLGKSPTPTAEHSIQQGFTVVVDDLDQACKLCDHLAPEHLQLMVQDRDRLIECLHNYGALFIGGHSAEVFGDYGAGPNHVLPTSGQAAQHSGLSVLNFLKLPTWMELNDTDQFNRIASDAAELAALEGLHWHARAARARLNR